MLTRERTRSRLGLASVAVALVSTVVLGGCGSSGGTSADVERQNGPLAVASAIRPVGITRREPSGVLHRLTTNRQDSYPTWSSDGTRIAFQRQFGKQGASHLFVMDGDGSDVHQVGDAVAIGQQFAWSPDGEELVYQGIGGIWTIDLDAAEERLLYPDKDGLTHQPAWSPDGKTIALAEAGKGLIQIDAERGSSPRVLVRLPRSQAQHLYVFFDPSWSPDGRRIAFLSSDLFGTGESGRPTSLVVVNADGSSRRMLTKLGSPAGVAETVHPTWSPDGRSIAYADHLGERYGIWVVSSSGGKPRLLLEGVGWTMPSWGPAGA